MTNEGTPSRTAGLAAARPVVVLVAICVVAGALLGFVHEATAPVIAANAEAKAQETYAALVPAASEFRDVPCDVEGCVAALQALGESGEVVGYVVVAESKGYGGPVPIAVAFDAAGEVANIAVMGNSETPGLGTRVADDAYVGQYVGRAAEPQGADSIDLISGATISSKAVLSAFNIAVTAYGEVR